jgi:hypothetical protein
MYALIENGQVTQYPYSISQLYADNPGTSFPATMPDERLADWGVYPVTTTTPPAYDTTTQKLVEETPANIGGTWTQVWAVYPLTNEELAATHLQIWAGIEAQVQARLDDFAKTRFYNDILSACSYATSTNQKYASEGQYCMTARDQTWDALFAIQAEVVAGTRPMPASYADIEAELPALVWPG